MFAVVVSHNNSIAEISTLVKGYEESIPIIIEKAERKLGRKLKEYEVDTIESGYEFYWEGDQDNQWCVGTTQLVDCNGIHLETSK